MKRFLASLLVIFIFLCGCKKSTNPKLNAKAPDSFLSGVWVTYSEVNELLKDNNFKSNYSKMIKDLKKQNITDIFIQIRPFCDSLYKSRFFPINEPASNYDFDVLAYIIKLAHKNEIKVHAWINPYRVKSSDTDISSLNPQSPAYKWLTDDLPDNDKNICFQNGIYLNPASNDVKNLVLNGVREILNNYNIDGIHIDDYFYPTTSPDFDAVSYNEYLQTTENPLPLEDYRRSHINSLISSIYTAVKFKDKSIVFSVSPSASISKNKNEYYADINAWVENECVDIIIPQIYFGFEYPDESFRFDNVLNNYEQLPYKSTKLVIGLATYKIGTTIEPDNTEWANGKEIIDKQIQICKKDLNVSGIVFFSYSSFLEYKKSPK